MRRALLAALVALLAIPAVADAGTLRLQESFNPGDSQSNAQLFVTVTFTARAGEANDVSYSIAGNRLTFRDAVPITAGRGCSRTTPREVVCVLRERGFERTVEVNALLGDGDDKAAPGADDLSDLEYSHLVDGGPGTDVLDASGASTGAQLEGGDGDDRLTGGPAPDRLTGGMGADDARGGAGDDVLDEGPPTEGDLARPVGPNGSTGDDRLDGGAGRDTVSYIRRRAPIRVDLGGTPAPSTPTQPAAQPPTGGQQGERDVLAGVEDAVGGDGDDTLLGDGRRNELSGQAGRDSLSGFGGPDVLDGGLGRDSFDGGDGDDRLSTGGVFEQDDKREREILCGDGDDVVGWPDSVDVLDRDCERVSSTDRSDVAVPTVRAHPTIRGRTLTLPVGCPRPERRCRGRLVVRSRPGGRTLGTARVRLVRTARAVRVALRARPSRSVTLELVYGKDDDDIAWSVPLRGAG